MTWTSFPSRHPNFQFVCWQWISSPTPLRLLLRFTCLSFASSTAHTPQHSSSTPPPHLRTRRILSATLVHILIHPATRPTCLQTVIGCDTNATPS
ncbi:hypothetical protein J1614_002613 [Plenodomus biglobosus]|nr:hypothetical protein J1614_002613 [Plenodomus biglobosus]